MSIKIEDNAVVLFQGDSITDCGRNRNQFDSMGNGYAMMAASWFNALYPDKNVTFINRGISGNRVKDLVSRWEKDCLDLQPSFLSILIGINDCWRRYDSNDPTSKEEFEAKYRKILEETRKKLNVKIILCEPFVLPVPEDRKNWREDLDPKIQVVRELAREYKTFYLPLDGLFARASTQREPEFWAGDGVHPTLPGHAFIAREWLKLIGLEF